MVFEVNNGMKLVFTQENQNKGVTVETLNNKGEVECEMYIPQKDMVMFYNLYAYVLEHGTEGVNVADYFM